MIGTIKKLLDLLEPVERRNAALLLSMILVMALLDTIGVASIMPFVAVVADPKAVESNTLLANLYAFFRYESYEAFLFALGVTVFVILMVSLAFKALTTYVQWRFILMREYSISRRLVEVYLSQPYTWFLYRHSADIGTSILSEVSQIVHGAMLPMMNLIAQGAVTLTILTLLVIVDTRLALMVAGVLVLAYGLIYWIMSGFLSRIGNERIEANQARFTAISESFGAAKEVKIGGLESAYVQRFSKPAKIYARHQASASVIAQLPRFALEAVAFGGMLLVILHLMVSGGDFADVVPILALYTFAGYRLMPAAQQIYGSLSQLRFANPALDSLHADLKELGPGPSALPSATVPLDPMREIVLDGVFFTYPRAPEPALLDVSLTIPMRHTIGIVGTTGSGKTTVVDLIMGLLKPDQGTLTVDGVIIDDANVRSWQRAIGYVPQQIYLADDSIAANIAFGLKASEIDWSVLERVAKIANLHEFVTRELPGGYATLVGERGVRLSGGQRQRIGIARALYHNPRFLILDEATSALDNLTEQAVMEAVHNLGNEIGIVLIAHRLSTVRACDRIYLFRKGRIAAQGTFDELVENDEGFRSMSGH